MFIESDYLHGFILVGLTCWSAQGWTGAQMDWTRWLMSSCPKSWSHCTQICLSTLGMIHTVPLRRLHPGSQSLNPLQLIKWRLKKWVWSSIIMPQEWSPPIWRPVMKVQMLFKKLLWTKKWDDTDNQVSQTIHRMHIGGNTSLLFILYREALLL